MNLLPALQNNFCGTALVCFLALFASYAQNTHAAEAEFGIGADFAHIENPRRTNTPGDQDEDLQKTLRFDARLQRETQFFRAELTYSGENRDFKNDLMEDRNVVAGIGSLVWKINPDIFEWELSNSRSNQLLNTINPDISDNRQVVDITSTGPTLNMLIDRANLLSLRANFSKATFEQTETINQNRRMLNAGFTRLITRRLNTTFNVNYLESDFILAQTFSFDTLTYSLINNYTTEVLNISLELGQINISRTGQKDTSNPVFRLEGTLDINSRAGVTLSYSETTEDLLSDIQNSPVRANIPLEDDSLLQQRLGSSNRGGLFELQNQRISFRYAEPASYALNFGYSISDRQYDVQNDFELDESVFLNFSLNINARSRAALFARKSQIDSTRFLAKQDRTETGVSYNYTINNQMFLNFVISNMDQTSESDIYNFDGYSASIGLEYRR